MHEAKQVDTLRIPLFLEEMGEGAIVWRVCASGSHRTVIILEEPNNAVVSISSENPAFFS